MKKIKRVTALLLTFVLVAGLMTVGGLMIAGAHLMNLRLTHAAAARQPA